MTIMIGDAVLVSHGLSLLDAKVKELRDAETETANPAQVLVQYLVDSDRPDEWVTRDRVLEDTQSNREKIKAINQKKSETVSPSVSLEKLFGPKRLDAIAAWMNSVDVTFTRLDKDVKNLIEHQANQAAQLKELERRKKEAMEKKAELHASVLNDLKRVKVAEETAMARKRLQNAGVAQEEIDAILPVIPHED
ncbi:hypothetical protein F441_13115 [Phytophthora nicotianae CJ01A1]|uniref:Uncharacterized protein n=6 Tax=Phytophthora nicotianae TaxID=4792 RepID=W2R6I3_PHYN3|nr:hypothetical protein PPTG_03203 [Phytophthora nicotianae INRA-310]ETI41625.1 hypothetical protein F443_13157 [Phytophthora nicotianae P1569]ETK81658.1 hypothetical protein L915_12853 [Phytophthora nicotianae]ETO70257.1 hypothetical protein F444_13234 [Phytophthora nicotianae P1976]ETP11359.1 hypothetical protein F441_13115 [Phytophthora nicotianae CJ01A1]ETP39498.1 hypothetical protein F442_13034 [Phytophthora nicotianae P10297]KUF78074.1 hypothetical protein AM587_10010284 [Phytophthora n